VLALPARAMSKASAGTDVMGTSDKHAAGASSTIGAVVSADVDANPTQCAIKAI
jgi:hypothetical protein